MHRSGELGYRRPYVFSYPLVGDLLHKNGRSTLLSLLTVPRCSAFRKHKHAPSLCMVCSPHRPPASI